MASLLVHDVGTLVKIIFVLLALTATASSAIQLVAETTHEATTAAALALLWFLNSLVVAVSAAHHVFEGVHLVIFVLSRVIFSYQEEERRNMNPPTWTEAAYIAARVSTYLDWIWLLPR